MKKLVLLFAIFALAAGSAFAGPKISLVGAGTYLKPTLADGATGFDSTKEKLGIGGGLLVGFPLGAKAELEIGGLYAPRKTEIVSTGDTTPATLQFTGIQIPAMFRIHLGNVVSLAAGGYYWMAMGDNYTASAEADGLSASVDRSYSDSHFKKADYGVQGGIGFAFPMGGSAHFIIDANYVMGLANNIDLQEGQTGTMKWGGFQGLVGLRFGGK